MNPGWMHFTEAAHQQWRALGRAVRASGAATMRLRAQAVPGAAGATAFPCVRGRHGAENAERPALVRRPRREASRALDQ
jgi:hypothetical protein